jgi:hypothetical protein
MTYLEPVVKTQQALMYGVTQITGLILETPQELQDFLEENKEKLDLMAKIRFLAMEYSGTQIDDWDSAIDYQAAELQASGVASYHPAGYKTVMEFMHDALQGSVAGSGAYYRAKNLVELVIPYCQSHGISVPETVLDKGNKSKFGLVGERSAAIIEAVKAGEVAQAEGDRRIQSMMADVVNPEVTVEAFKDAHPTGNPPKRVPSHAYSYVLPGGRTLLLIDFTNMLEYQALIKLADGRLDLHHGDGSEEPFHALTENKYE